jgi:hypothetical protein
MLVSRRRRRRKLAKILVPLVAGSVCGALWILLVDTAANTAIPDAMNEPAVLAVGVVTALGAATLLSLPNRLSEMVGLSAMAIGFHSLALPIAALISAPDRGSASRGSSHCRPQRRRTALGLILGLHRGSSSQRPQDA